jgi:hypothetical protein
MSYNKRHERLNALARINSASTYLEVGVFQGETLEKVNVPCKVAVDPKFMFDYKSLASPTLHFHQVTSDVFFETQATKFQKFDLIYLDGLHTFEQTFRDFQNSLNFSHEKSIWLIDDTCPTSWLASLRNHLFVKMIYALINAKTRSWMGDVYKTIFEIHSQYMEMNYATFSGHGQTAVWFEKRNDADIINLIEKPVNSICYLDFTKHKEAYMKISSAEDIFDSISRSRQQS